MGADRARAPGTSGRSCPAERGEQQLQTGDAAGAAALLTAMQRFASGVGLIPEQDWELPDLAASPFGTDPTLASIGFVNGRPGGLGGAADVVGGVVRPPRRATSATGRSSTARSATFDRYVAHTQGTTTLTVTAPADQSAVPARR